MKSATGILLIAHAPLASAFSRAASDIGLPVSHLAALDAAPGVSRANLFAAAKTLLANLRLENCLVLTDLGGCSAPVTVAQLLRGASATNVRIVTGLNMPMLATALSHLHRDLDSLAEHVARRGADGTIAV
ncbi:MAG: PTS sugar transporter subunit IIB [Variovorax sp.]